MLQFNACTFHTRMDQTCMDSPKRGGPVGVGSRRQAYGPSFESWQVPCQGGFLACIAPHLLAPLGCQGEVCGVSVAVAMTQSNISQQMVPLLSHALGGKSHMVALASPFVHQKKKKKKPCMDELNQVLCKLRKIK